MCLWCLWYSVLVLIGTQKAPSGTPVPELQVILASRWQVRMSHICLCFTYKC